jgi:hypothetical protein
MKDDIKQMIGWITLIIVCAVLTVAAILFRAEEFSSVFTVLAAVTGVGAGGLFLSWLGIL